MLVEFTVRLGYAIFTVATLSFLGFGISRRRPTGARDIAANYGVLAGGLLVGRRCSTRSLSRRWSWA